MAATWNNATWNNFVWNQTGSGGSPTGGGQKPKPTHMRDLTIYPTNPFDDPPTQAQMQTIADKIDELITAGQR